MAESYRWRGSHLDTIERPFYIRTIHTKQHSPRPYSAHVTSVGSDDPGFEIPAPFGRDFPCSARSPSTPAQEVAHDPEPCELAGQ